MAGWELVQGSSIRDWRALTMRAVAERAGVNERTVYRHFANERELRDEVMRRMEQQAGINIDELQLEDAVDVTARIFELVSSHPLDRHPELDPTLRAAGQRTRDGLRRAMAARTEGWPEREQTIAAAMIDVLWAVAGYERLVVDWHLDQQEAVEGITWVVGLIEQAVRDGRRPRG